MLLLLAFAFFLCWSSLLNGIAHRLLKERAILDYKPRCRTCEEYLAWYDVVPLISFMIWGGKCRLCKAHHSLLYPLLEFFDAGILSALFYVNFALGHLVWGIFIPQFFFVSALLLALRTDLEEFVILRISSLYLIPVWLLCAFAGFLQIDFIMSFLGALCGYALPWFAGYLYRKMRGVNGIGEGDFEFLGMIGSFLGPIKMLDVLVIACVIAVVVGIVVAVATQAGRNLRLPFAPFLVAGALIILFS